MVPKVATVALEHLVNAMWHHTPSGKMPWLQAARIYVECLSAGRHFIDERRDMAHAASRALVHMYLYRKCFLGCRNSGRITRGPAGVSSVGIELVVPSRNEVPSWRYPSVSVA